MKIYLSGPITGDNNYLEHFNLAEEMASCYFENALIINPAKLNAEIYKERGYEYTMQICLAELAGCDAILMLDGWEKSLGANREYGYAMGADLIVAREKNIYEQIRRKI